MVTGVAGGDQKAAAKPAGDIYRDKNGGKGGDGGVLRDRRLTLRASVESACPGEVGSGDNGENTAAVVGEETGRWQRCTTSRVDSFEQVNEESTAEVLGVSSELGVAGNGEASRRPWR